MNGQSFDQLEVVSKKDLTKPFSRPFLKGYTQKQHFTKIHSQINNTA